MDCGHFAADTQGYLGLLAEPCTINQTMNQTINQTMNKTMNRTMNRTKIHEP